MLGCLGLQTILESGSEDEKYEAKQLLATLQSKNRSRKRKTLGDEGNGKQPKKTSGGAVSNTRSSTHGWSWAMPLACATVYMFVY